MKMKVELTPDEMRERLNRSLAQDGFEVKSAAFLHDKTGPSGAYRVSGYQAEIRNIIPQQAALQAPLEPEVLEPNGEPVNP